MAQAQTRFERIGSGKFLAFWLGAEEFAVSVDKIREIIPHQEITPVPQAPPFVCGVINLRGKVVPVVDLKARLGVPPVEAARGCIVVMQPRSGKDALQIGVVVDGVSEVMHIPASEVEDTASFSQGLIETSFISGVAKTRGHVKMLLNIDAALAIDQPMAMAG